VQPKECGWARTARNGEFTDLGAGRFPPGFAYVWTDTFSSSSRNSFWHANSLQLNNVISSALFIGEVSSIWVSLHLRNFSATEK